MQPSAKEVSDADMNYLEKADMQGGEYVLQQRHQQWKNWNLAVLFSSVITR